jgi:hypothetical protein
MEPKLTSLYFCSVSDTVRYNDLLSVSRVSPELKANIVKHMYNTKDEIYAFSMLMWQLFTRMKLEDIAKPDPKWRPDVPTANDLKEQKFLDLMCDCWNELPDCRPNAQNVVYRLGTLLEDR